MTTRALPGEVVRALSAMRGGRLVALLFAAVAAGLAADWLRSDGRLVFPRPLPAFTTTPRAR